MISVESVNLARTTPTVLIDIYRKIFFDGNKPKLRMWMIKKGVPYSDLDDLETEMKFAFISELNKYEYTKIDFEKYIWTDFSHILINYFQSKKLKKNNNLRLEFVTEKVVVDIGYIEVNKYDKSDFEILFLGLTRIQATMCRLIYYNDWNKEQIKNFLGMNKDDWENNLTVIKKNFLEYLSN